MRHVQVCDSGVVAIEPVEVIFQVLLIAGELEELALGVRLRCLLRKVVTVLVHCIVISMRVVVNSFNILDWLGSKLINCKGGTAKALIVQEPQG